MDEIMISLKGMRKSFGNVQAVSDVSMDIGRGEVRALIGENGSGKSTLAALITGAQKADGGTIEYQGHPFVSKGIVDAKKRGIAVLVQEKGTVNGLTVAENVFLGTENRCRGKLGISRKRMNTEAQKILDKIGAADISAAMPVDRLPFESRKLIEVARAMMDDPDILIVDETTTALSMNGREIIYRIIREMKQAQKTVIFISHDLEEVMEVCDSASVLRDGKFVKTVGKEEMSQDRLRSLMIGRELGGHYYRTDLESRCGGEVILRAEGICLSGILEDVSFELHKGEILGLGGLTECGMHELCKVVFGAIRPDRGQTEIIRGGTAEKITDCAGAVRNKIAYLPKDRDAEALFAFTSIQDNITSASLDEIRKGIYIPPADEKRNAQKQAEDLSVKCSGIGQDVSELSGGNKQKVVIGKWLANDSEILIMDCPTRGIDIGVKSAIYTLMEKLAAEGKAILMVSEEMPELIGMSDRIIILKDGRVANTFTRDQDLKEEDLVSYII